jgi:Amt family ammonium transporter
MAAGFAMLESGLVRSKNVATICLKNIALFGVAGILFYLTGYNLMYAGVDGGWIGSFGIWAADDAAALAGDYSGNYAAASDWFFQMVFCGAACSVVSGCVAERIKLWSFMVFCVVLTGFIYPIQGSWVWGGGWLSEMGFTDYAGSTLVHSVGGWAALTGAIILGARKGKYGKDGRVNAMPGSNIPLATIGTFILWMGWYGFNGGSVLSLGSAGSAIEMSNVFVNTNTAACGGMLAAMLMVQILYKKTDVTMALNGALAGLVSITAGPATPSLGAALLIGAVGGVLVVLAVPFFDKLKIDDVVGALSVHLVCGIWGTLAVPFTNSDASFATQAIGVAAIGAFVLVTSAITWFVVKLIMGLRCNEEEEMLGLDVTEIGLSAYPDFQKTSQ